MWTVTLHSEMWHDKKALKYWTSFQKAVNCGSFEREICRVSSTTNMFGAWWWELQPSKIRKYIQNLKFPEPLEWDDTHSWRVSFPIIVMFHTAGWYVSFFVLLLLPGNSWWTVVITELDSHLMKIKTLWQQDKRLVLMRCPKIVLMENCTLHE